MKKSFAILLVLVVLQCGLGGIAAAQSGNPCNNTFVVSFSGLTQRAGIASAGATLYSFQFALLRTPNALLRQHQARPALPVRTLAIRLASPRGTPTLSRLI